VRRRIAGISIVVLLLIFGTVWSIRSRAEARLDKVREMGKEVFRGGTPPTPEKREEFRSAVGQLSDAQRETLREEGRREFERRENERITAFFAMSPQQQTAYLDKQIQDDEKRAKDWAARRAQAGQSTNAAGTAQGPGQMGARRGGQSASPEQRMERRNQRLASSTPQQRAQRDAYRAAMQRRRVELGLPPNPPRGPRPR
jgi:hypothetical protein